MKLIAVKPSLFVRRRREAGRGTEMRCASSTILSRSGHAIALLLAGNRYARTG
jgi:hypothetical protein